MIRPAAWLLLLALPALAGEPRQTVSVDVKDQPLAKVLRGIAADTGRTVVLDPKVPEVKLSLTLRQVPWRDAVQLAAERVRCEVQELPGGGLYVTRPPQVTIQLSQADIRTALLLLSRLGGHSIVIGPQVQGRVTLELRDVSWARALKAVAVTHGFEVVEGDELWSVGATGGAGGPLKSDARVLVGTFEALTPEGMTIAIDKDHEAKVELPEGAKGKKLAETVAKLVKGDRVAVSLAPVEGRNVLADIAIER